jgi:hypothetical protein
MIRTDKYQHKKLKRSIEEDMKNLALVEEKKIG